MITSNKTKFFQPKQHFTDYNAGFTGPRFFDDYDHMLSIIGLIRYAMWINVVENSELIETITPDNTKRIARLEQIKRQDQQIYRQIPFERKDVPPALEPNSTENKQISDSSEDTKYIK